MARIVGLFSIRVMSRRTALFAGVAALLLGLSGTVAALDMASLTNQDAVAGLKAALDKGTQLAVQRLGAENGFFGNDRIKIPLPESLQKVESGLRAIGMGKQADELVLRMNRAAEAAVPEAKTLFVNAVKQMTVQDAKGILSGGNDAATQYFRQKTSDPLAQKFLPIVQKAMAKVKLAEVYDKYAERGAQFGLVKKEDVKLESYITRKALDGLYVAVAEEEAKIRANPVQEGSAIIRKVFGLLGK